MYNNRLSGFPSREHRRYAANDERAATEGLEREPQLVQLLTGLAPQLLLAQRELYRRRLEQALDLEPENPRIAGNLARVYVRGNRTDDKTRKLLESIVMKDTRPDWIAWARERLALMGAKSRPTTTPSSTPDQGEPPTIEPGESPGEDNAGRS